jgi:hypothetical protein
MGVVAHDAEVTHGSSSGGGYEMRTKISVTRKL